MAPEPRGVVGDGSPTGRKIGRVELAAEVTVSAAHDVEFHLESIRADFLNRFSCHVHEFYPDAVITSSVTSKPDALASSSGTGHDAAWLIERGQSEHHIPTVWWIAGPDVRYRDGEDWTTDASKATRFSSEAEAQEIVKRLFPPSRIGEQPTTRATEHGFIKAADLPVAAPDRAEVIREYLRDSVPPPSERGVFPAADAYDALVALLAERQQDKRAALELVALTLAVYGDTGSKAAETIPQRVWDDLHERGLVRTGQDFTGEGSTDATLAGRDYLIDALAAAAALAVEEDAPDE